MAQTTPSSRANNGIVFYIVAFFVALFVGIGIYYLIPGVSHPFFSGDDPHAHAKVAAASFVLAVIGLIITRFVRPTGESQR